jgi:hypothetical protein
MFILEKSEVLRQGLTFSFVQFLKHQVNLVYKNQLSKAR